MIGHQGIHHLEVGNTCSGFVAAGNRTYRGIETDVHVTADGQYIIIYDDNTINTTGDDYVVEEIRALGWLENTVFISFSHDNMVELRRLLPDAKLMFLITHVPNRELGDMLLPRRLDLDIARTVLTPKENSLSALERELSHMCADAVNGRSTNPPQRKRGRSASRTETP